MNIDLSEKPIRHPRVLFSPEFEGWGVLFHPDTGGSVDLNPVAVVVWQKIDGKHRLEEIITEIECSFAQVPNSVVEDVTAFIHSLVNRGFVVREP